MIGKYGLGPTSSSMDATRSAFNAPPPIGLLSLSLPFPLSLLFLLTPHLFLSHLPSALQKSFILPRGVTGLLLLSLCSRLFSLTLPSVAMHHTVTERGITNKNLLIGLSTGQLLSLDTRAIDPRRPLGAPSQLEKEEVPHLSSLLLCSALLCSLSSLWFYSRNIPLILSSLCSALVLGSDAIHSFPPLVSSSDPLRQHNSPGHRDNSFFFFSFGIHLTGVVLWHRYLLHQSYAFQRIRYACL
jgi:hypothetical protein